MRYQDTGNVHMDFHLATNTTIHYVLEEYGETFLKELWRRTAQQVYKDIYEHLKQGDMHPLLEHWEYYFKREKGVFHLTKDSTGAVLVVDECPAVRHLREKGVAPDPCFCSQTKHLNEAWSEGTPFEIATETTGVGSCRQVIRRKAYAAQ